MNLVTNSIDACANVESPQNGARVILRSISKKDCAVEYQVIDNGIGMDEEIKKKIFQRFFSTKGSGGTGLGLMITKKIIEDHGGIIEFQSEEKKGTRFIIRLPKKDQPFLMKTD